MLPDLPGVAQNLAFANDLADLPDIPFFEDKSWSNPNTIEPAVLLSASLPVLDVKQDLPPRPLPPTEAPPSIPVLPDPIAELPKPVLPQHVDEPGELGFNNKNVENASQS